jgi:hypothetical protein
MVGTGNLILIMYKAKTTFSCNLFQQKLPAKTIREPSYKNQTKILGTGNLILIMSMAKTTFSCNLFQQKLPAKTRRELSYKIKPKFIIITIGTVKGEKKVKVA